MLYRASNFFFSYANKLKTEQSENKIFRERAARWRLFLLAVVDGVDAKGREGKSLHCEE